MIEDLAQVKKEMARLNDAIHAPMKAEEERLAKERRKRRLEEEAEWAANQARFQAVKLRQVALRVAILLAWDAERERRCDAYLARREWEGERLLEKLYRKDPVFYAPLWWQAKKEPAGFGPGA